MILGKVIGNVVSTKKAPEIVGCSLLLIDPVYEGDTFVAADTMGAGIGEMVLVTTDNTHVAAHRELPIDAMIIGIVDNEPKL